MGEEAELPEAEKGAGGGVGERGGVSRVWGAAHQTAGTQGCQERLTKGVGQNWPYLKAPSPLSVLAAGAPGAESVIRMLHSIKHTERVQRHMAKIHRRNDPGASGLHRITCKVLRMQAMQASSNAKETSLVTAWPSPACFHP